MEVSYLVAFGSGLVSFFAPCLVPLLPAYVSYVSGVSVKELKLGNNKAYRKQVLVSSLLYVLGFSLVFVVLGTSAASLSGVFRANQVWIQRWGGVLVMVFALSFMDVIKVPLLREEHRLVLPRWVEKMRYGRAFLVGVAFATAWTPCVGAVLGAILTLAATSQTAVHGAMLLFVYSLGISVPFLIVSLMLSRVEVVLRMITKYLGIVSKVAGLLLLLIGFLLFNNSLKWGADWLTYDALNGWLFGVASRWGWRIR